MVRAGERIHVMGMAGSGAAGVALLCAHAGARVDGCDAAGPSPYSAPLEAAGVPLRVGHDPSHLGAVERVAISPALRAGPQVEELAAADRAGLPVVSWQTLLGELMSARGRLGLAVTGTHGKSTTTALLGHMLVEAGLDPTVEVGAFIPAWGASVRPGGGAPFLVEADEFGDNFLNYRPALVILTNVEMDHPDFFADEAAVVDSFARFLAGMRADERIGGGRLLLAAAGQPGIDRVLAAAEGWKGRVVRYAAEERPAADVAARDVRFTPSGTTFRLFEQAFEMSLAGEHNVANAVAALAAARELGVPPDALAAGLASFRGAGRRLELIAEAAGVTIYDDYGHHPTEIRATLAAARQVVGVRRLWAVFEPHMFSRTALLLDQFAAAFRAADEVVIADIFPSRDADTSVASADGLADAVERVSAVPTIATGDVDATARYVAEHVREGDVVLVMGAGKSYRIARQVADALRDGLPATRPAFGLAER